MVKLKENFEALGGGGDDDGPWYTKVIDSIGNSQAALDFIAKPGGRVSPRLEEIQRDLGVS